MVRVDTIVTMRGLRRAVTTLAVAVVGIVSPVRAQSGYELFQQALVMERSKGDVREAIELYQRIVGEHADDRTLVARSLVRLGRAFETVGSTEAIVTYERVVREYADQSESATQAKARLDALQPANGARPNGQVARLLATDAENCEAWNMEPSPDGLRILSIDYCYTGALQLRDVASGEVAPLTDTRAWHLSAVWSPDGTRILTAATAPGAYRVYVLELESRVETTPAALDGLVFGPQDWSSDGDHVSGTLRNEDGSTSSVVISLRTADRFTLAARVNQGGAATAFSPDGRFVAFTDFSDENQDIYVMTIDGRVRYRITDDLSADGTPKWSPDGRKLLYQNPEGAWIVDMANGQSQGPPRLVRDSPFEYPAAWLDHGFYYGSNNAVARLHAITVDPETGVRTGDPRLLPIPVEAPQWLAWSPDMRHLATTNWEERRIRVITGGAVTEIPLGTEILVSNLWWSADGEAVLFTTADRAQRRRGWKTVFALDPDEGEVRELFPKQDSINHLHVSPDGTRMTFLRNTPTRRMSELVVAPVGERDGIVLAASDTATGALSTRFGQPLFSPTGEYVLFMRAHGSGERGSLWIARSDGTEPPRVVAHAPYFTGAFWDPSGRRIVYQTDSTISVVDVGTGATRTVADAGEMRGELKAWSPDGRWIVVSVTTGAAEFWVVEDLLGEGGNQR